MTAKTALAFSAGFVAGLFVLWTPMPPGWAEWLYEHNPVPAWRPES